MHITTGLLTGAGSAVAVLAAVVKGCRAVSAWLDDDRIAAALDRMDRKDEVAARLDALHEHGWANEMREVGKMAVMNRLARFEVNRRSRLRLAATCLGCGLFASGIVAVLISRDSLWIRFVGECGILASYGLFLWWLISWPFYELRVQRVSRERYDGHVPSGHFPTRSGSTQTPGAMSADCCRSQDAGDSDSTVASGGPRVEVLQRRARRRASRWRIGRRRMPKRLA